VRKKSAESGGLMYVGLFCKDCDLRVKRGHKLELEQVELMLAVDERFDFFVLADTCADILIQHGVGEAEVILVGLAGESVGGDFLNEVEGESELFAYLLYLGDGEVGQRAEIAHGVAVAGGVADPVLREIAGIYDSAAAALADCIDGGHTQTRREVDARLLGKFKLGGNGIYDTVIALLD